MVLIIGGAGSGKRDYVKSLGYAEADIADGQIDDRSVVYDLQDIVFDDPGRAPELVERLLTKRVVVCDEVGSGIIPLTLKERKAREATGRLCISLAERAERVVRLVCGIPMVIKG